MSETEKLNRIGAEVMGYLIDPDSRDIKDDTEFVYSPGKVTRDGIFGHYMYYRSFRHGGVKWSPPTNLLQAWEVGSKVGALWVYQEPNYHRPFTDAEIVAGEIRFFAEVDGTTPESAALAIMRAVAKWHEGKAELKRIAEMPIEQVRDELAAEGIDPDALAAETRARLEEVRERIKGIREENKTND